MSPSSGGMGGGFSASALAEAGYDVLLIDRGNEEISPPAPTALLNGQEAQLAESRWPTMSAFEVDGVVNRCWAPFGSGVGGSTNLYAAALERFDSLDIDADRSHPDRGMAD